MSYKLTRADRQTGRQHEQCVSLVSSAAAAASTVFHALSALTGGTGFLLKNVVLDEEDDDDDDDDGDEEPFGCLTPQMLRTTVCCVYALTHSLTEFIMLPLQLEREETPSYLFISSLNAVCPRPI